MGEISKAAAAVRSILKIRRQEALDGSLTTAEVIRQVKQILPGTRESTIFQAIENYGPIGEGDTAWLRRAEQPQIPSWFYSPSTGKEVQ